MCPSSNVECRVAEDDVTMRSYIFKALFFKALASFCLWAFCQTLLIYSRVLVTTRKV